MIFDKYNKALEYEIFINKEYWFLDNIIKSSKIIFDIWGHIWLFSKYCLLQNPKLKINMFEPTENIFLAQKILKNFENQICFEKFAIWANDWELEIFLTHKSMQNSHFNSFLNNSTTSQVFDMKWINSIFEKYEKVDLLKLDIEWMEFETLLALSEKNIKKIWNIIYEFHIFDTTLQNLHLQLLKKREKLWKKVKIIESKYTNKIGYILI